MTVVPRVKDENNMVATLKGAEDRIAEAVTDFSGSLRFIYIHSFWFGVWIAINLGVLGSMFVFDPFPFGLLTMIVSLEAIFLSTFVLIAQNRQDERNTIRSRIDFENNVRAEIWSVHIGQSLGVDVDHVESAVKETLEAYKAADV
jgi:uncharacterized membrane protein